MVQPEDLATHGQTEWTKEVSRQLLDFLSNMKETSTSSNVPDEMIFSLSTSELDNISKSDEIDEPIYLQYLSNHQQDDLLRKFILHDRTLTPQARCAECSNKASKTI